MSTISRGRLLGTAPIVALTAGGLLLAFQSAAGAASPGDIAALNAAIPLERAGIKAYADAASLGILSPGVLAVAKGFMADHMAHRDALIAAVKAGGGTPSEDTVKLVYPTLKTEKDILAFATSVERQAASAYLAVFPVLQDKALAKAAASILGVETMHVGILASAMGDGQPYHGFIS
jgi:Ferritin-like domain